jgi:hypothetical protein
VLDQVENRRESEMSYSQFEGYVVIVDSVVVEVFDTRRNVLCSKSTSERGLIVFSGLSDLGQSSSESELIFAGRLRLQTFEAEMLRERHWNQLR